MKGEINKIPFIQNFSNFIFNLISSEKFIIIQSIISLICIILNCSFIFYFGFNNCSIDFLKILLIIESLIFIPIIINNTIKNSERNKRLLVANYFLNIQTKAEVKLIKSLLQKIDSKISNK